LAPQRRCQHAPFLGEFVERAFGNRSAWADEDPSRWHVTTSSRGGNDCPQPSAEAIADHGWTDRAADGERHPWWDRVGVTAKPAPEVLGACSTSLIT